MKSVLLAFLVLALALPAGALAADAGDIRGYSKAAGHQYVQFGAYPTDADGAVRPILWRVLKAENGEAWLLSEYILFAAPVHGDHWHYNGWENSDLYAYLNNVFISDAFSESEQAALLIRTEDGAKVTLITSNDMKDASIGFSSNKDRLCESTPYASVAVDPPIFELPDPNFWKEERNQPHLFKYQKGGYKYSPWWSRTRSDNYPHEHRRVMDEGQIGRISTGNSDLGVRPTVYVDLSALSLSGGSGSMADPWVLTAGPDTALPEAAETPALPEDTPVPEEESLDGPVPEAAAEQPPDEPAKDAPEAPAEDVPEAETTGAAAEADERFPALTAQGFLPDGEAEFVYMSEEEGVWLYASQSLRIEIRRQTGVNAKKDDVTWYESHIYSNDPQQLFRPIPYETSLRTNWRENKWCYPADIVAKNHLVFAINCDHFIYRVARTHDDDGGGALGLIIRDGEILFEKQKSAESRSYPPLDIMALYPDGSVQTFVTRSKTGKELLAAGVADTLSFGPILVEGGEISERSRLFGETFQPRTAFGVAEPGHYVTLTVEGRRSGYGQSCIWLAEKMKELGCQTAINLDGGGTTALLLMGRQINKSGSFGGESHRLVNEVLGIGYSEAVQ